MIFLGRGQIKRDQSTSGGKTFSFSNLKGVIHRPRGHLRGRGHTAQWREGLKNYLSIK